MINALQSSATMTSKGQITVPADIRAKLGIRAGDRLDFHLADTGTLSVVAVKRRSILESRQDREPLSLGRPLTQADIDDAVGEAMIEQEIRISGKR